ncbi:hypothetical protein JCM13591A_06730 [Microbacterium xylanilyticum]
MPAGVAQRAEHGIELRRGAGHVIDTDAEVVERSHAPSIAEAADIDQAAQAEAGSRGGLCMNSSRIPLSSSTKEA